MLLDDDKLAVDETQRIAHHEAVKGEARKGVHAEIAREELQGKDQLFVFWNGIFWSPAPSQKPTIDALGLTLGGVEA